MDASSRISPVARLAPLSGAASAALWAAALAVDQRIDSRAADARIVAFWSQRGHRRAEIAVFFLVLAAAGCFAWFVSLLSQRILGAEPAAGAPAAVAFGSGLLAAGLWIVAAATWAAVPATIDIEEANRFVVDPNTYRLLGGFGDLVFFAGSTIALLLVAAVSVAGRRSGALPRPLVWAGFAIAASLTVSFVFLPFLAFLAWMVALSLTVAHRPARWHRAPPDSPGRTSSLS